MAYKRSVGSETYVKGMEQVSDKLALRSGFEPLSQSFRDSRSSAELTKQEGATFWLLSETYVGEQPPILTNSLCVIFMLISISQTWKMSSGYLKFFLTHGNQGLWADFRGYKMGVYMPTFHTCEHLNG
jgi:hypothetical protein